MSWIIVRADNFGRSGDQPGYDEVVHPFAGETLEDYSKEVVRLNQTESYYYRVEPNYYKLAKFHL